MNCIARSEFSLGNVQACKPGETVYLSDWYFSSKRDLQVAVNFSREINSLGAADIIFDNIQPRPKLEVWLFDENNKLLRVVKDFQTSLDNGKLVMKGKAEFIPVNKTKTIKAVIMSTGNFRTPAHSKLTLSIRGATAI